MILSIVTIVTTINIGYIIRALRLQPERLKYDEEMLVSVLLFAYASAYYY